MELTNVQIVTNEDGEQTAVLVPIDVWREVESWLETAHLLRSDAMRERLLAARASTMRIPMNEVAREFGVEG
ncbi:MAG: prevent-host-death protein [Rhodothermales bacterium]|nr:prevent-host-death protein [Rhodothermales bacterium]